MTIATICIWNIKLQLCFSCFVKTFKAKKTEYFQAYIVTKLSWVSSLVKSIPPCLDLFIQIDKIQLLEPEASSND